MRLALDWLARHQDDDGRWSCSDFMRHDPRGPPRADGGIPSHDVGVTGLALLCFLDAGCSDRGDGEKGYYNINVEHGLRWLCSTQDAEGVFGSRATHVRKAYRNRSASADGASFKIRTANPWANSTNCWSLASVSDCSGVFERLRRVHATLASGKSKTVIAG